MNAFNFLFLSAVVILISFQLIVADSDWEDNNFKRRSSNRQNNRVGRRDNRQHHRSNVWEDIKSWFKTGHQNRKSRRYNHRSNRSDKRDKRQGRKHERQNNRHNRRDDFFDNTDW